MAISMTSRQRLQTVLSRGVPDRIPLVDISFWPETLERWHEEGLPTDMAPDKHFSLDRIESFTFDGTLGLPAEIVEENEQWRVRRDANGLFIKEWTDWRVSYSPPVRLDCRVKTWDDWRQVKGRLQVHADRIGERW